MRASFSLDAWPSLRARDFEEWQALADASASSQPFLLPGFVQAAAQWLTPRQPPCVLRIRREDGTLIGLTCVEPREANFFVPMRHWRGYRHDLSFQSGWLYRHDDAGVVGAAIRDALASSASPVRALLLHNLVEEDALTRHLCGAGASVHWHPTRRFQRPVLKLRADAPAATRMRASVLKDLRRRLRRLREDGEISVRVLQGAEANEAAADRHLYLENADWKGAERSSMMAVHGQRGFFLEMAARLRRQHALAFVELRLGERVIASTSNLISAGVLSGFKTGWDPEYRQASPGRIVEWLMFEQMGTHWPNVHTFDSQAQESSYLAELLPDRQTMISGILVGGAARHHWLKAARVLRPLAYRLGHDD